MSKLLTHIDTTNYLYKPGDIIVLGSQQLRVIDPYLTTPVNPRPRHIGIYPDDTLDNILAWWKEQRPAQVRSIPRWLGGWTTLMAVDVRDLEPENNEYGEVAP